LPFGSFADVISGPQRLQIGVVKALPLLFWIGEIKACARADVVYVPAITPVIVPAHAISELGFKVMAQLLNGAADQPCGLASLGAKLLSNTSTVQPISLVVLQALAPNCFLIEVLISDASFDRNLNAGLDAIRFACHCRR
jgi:hypothetical protein